ncbi:ImmA/IrrE family metallo-endopeptidase [Jiella pelagia]|uniref:ImmA/IrrE family metallo-endopeptidase n=1 Tax=Jiella pelagia TaxID=2986949 RepID=A0ABY7BU88_9HYPH|nr:ImmA/IrrE family metallo-endopeptidase [Jiella pelagia]WAP66852.1 ImmA/IrrE family metallo-endopeptidase [Jiella pelagia]
MASKQIIRRPTLFFEAVAKFDLRALYLPDNKRILLDQSQPELKHRWHEAHEIGHSIIPWHEGAMLGDDRFTLNQNCHDQVEAEANFAAGRLLFLRDRFTAEARDHAPSIEAVRALKPVFGNTYTMTFWRSIETWGVSLPIVGMISDHPHPARRSADFDLATPCEHLVRSPAFAAGFNGVGEAEVFESRLRLLPTATGRAARRRRNCAHRRQWRCPRLPVRELQQQLPGAHPRGLSTPLRALGPVRHLTVTAIATPLDLALLDPEVTAAGVELAHGGVDRRPQQPVEAHRPPGSPRLAQ